MSAPGRPPSFHHLFDHLLVGARAANLLAVYADSEWSDVRPTHEDMQARVNAQLLGMPRRPSMREQIRGLLAEFWARHRLVKALLAKPATRRRLIASVSVNKAVRMVEAVARLTQEAIHDCDDQVDVNEAGLDAAVAGWNEWRKALAALMKPLTEDDLIEVESALANLFRRARPRRQK